jgi:hypothetical protein
MITQYDAVAEIEALKWRLTRPDAGTPADRMIPPEVAPAWQRASEADIRREMERRLARRVTTTR